MRKLSKLIIILLSLTLIFLPSGQIFAYDDETTHPALTQEIIEFYNLLHPENKITSEEKEWIIAGSINEDEWPRWLNHFYDPVYKSGWTGEKMGNVPSSIARALSAVGLSTTGSYSAVNWINNIEAQKQYSNYGGDRTWKTGLEYFAKGDRKNAYINLGHALHLLEDMSVPEHSRNDTHAPLGGDEGSPFENYLRKWNRSSIKSLSLPLQLTNSKTVSPSFSSIEEYLVNMATYSNKYFFSKDTINDPKYQFPKIVRDDGNYGYGIDENGREFPIAKIRKRWNENTKIFENTFELLKQDSHYPILDAYFSRLAPKVILYGAGVIDLFKKQAEDEIVKREYPVRLVRYDFSFLTPKTFSLAAEGRKLFNVAQNILANVTETAASVFGTIGSVFQKENPVKKDELPQPAPAVVQAILSSEVTPPPIVQKISPVVKETTASAQNLLQPTTNNPLQLIETAANPSVVKRIDNNLPAAPISQNTQNNTRPNISFPAYSSFSSSGGGSGVLVNNNISPSASALTPTSTESTATSTATSTDPAATSTATSTDSTATSTATSTEPAASSTPPNIPQVLISEIYPDKSGNNYDFIELYNKSTSSIDLSSYSLRILKAHATSTEPLAVFSGESSSQIAGKGFFLIGFDRYNLSNFRPADVFRSSRFLPSTETAKIILLNGENIVDEFEYDPTVLAVGNSFERKALSGDSCVSSQNAGEFLGNGCDTDNAADWETRGSANPQNSQNLPEPRTAPQISNFTAEFNATTGAITFSWGESSDVLGATSTVVYELKDAEGNLLWSGAGAYQFVFAVAERGRDYEFSLRALDRDGLSGESSSLTVNVPLPQQEEQNMINQWTDAATGFNVMVGFNSPPAPGVHLMATSSYTGPDQFIVRDVTWSAIDNSYNNHAPCCNFIFIVIKDQNGNTLATSSESGPQFGTRTSFADVVLSPGAIIEYYVRDIQGGSNWTFSDFTFHRAPPPKPVRNCPESSFVCQLDDPNVAGPFAGGSLPGRIGFIFQFLGKGWQSGTTISAVELKYRAPSPWNVSIVGAPECNNFDPPVLNFYENRVFSLETDFEAGTLKVYRYGGLAPLVENWCYAIMVQFFGFSSDNYIAGNSENTVIRPDYITDRNHCNAKDGSGGNIGACAYGDQGDYVAYAFFRVFGSN